MAHQLKLEVLLQAIDRVTRPIKAIIQGNKELTRVLRASQDKLKELNKVQNHIDGFRKLSKDLTLTNQQFKTAQDRVRALALQFNQTTQPTAAMSRALQTAKQAAGDLKQRSATLQHHLSAMRERLEAAGMSTRHLSQHQRDLKSQIASTNQVISQQQARLKLGGAQQQALHAARARYDNGMQRRNQIASGGTSMLGAGIAMGLPVAKMVKNYVSYEDAMTGIARQISGARDEAGKLTQTYRDMSIAIKKLSEEVPIPTTQLVDMTTAAARMNVGAELFEQAEKAKQAGDHIAAAFKQKEGIEELMDFNRTIAMMSVAFDSTPDDIAERMGKVANNFKIPITQMQSLADSINYLDDNAISKGDDIIDVLNRISGVISTVKMSSTEAAALASTLLTLGDRAETASTAIDAITQKFAAAEKGTKKFRDAVDEIGLNTQAIQHGMSQDAMGTLFKVITAIQALPKNKRAGIMVNLVGIEHSDTLAKLVSKSGELQRQINLAHSQAAQGSVKKEFLNKIETLSSRWQMLQNKVFNRSAEGGETLRESLASLMERIGKIIDQFHDWTKANPELTSTIIKVTAVLAGLVTMMGGLTLVLAALFGPLIMLRLAMTTLGIKGWILVSVLRSVGSALARLPGLLLALMTTGLRALAALSKSLLLLSRFLIAHPLIAAISTLALGAMWIWQNWSTIAPRLVAIWDIVTNTVSSAWQKIKHTTVQLWSVLKSCFSNGLTGLISQILNWSPLGLFYRAFAGVLNYFGVALPTTFTQFGKNILIGLAKGIGSAISMVKTAITGVAEQIVVWFKDKLGIHSPSRVFAQLGSFTLAGFEQGLSAKQQIILKNMQQFTKRLVTNGTLILNAPELANVLPIASSIVATQQAYQSTLNIDRRPALINKTYVDNKQHDIRKSNNTTPVIGAITINIHSQAGQDVQMIAREVTRQLENMQRQAAAKQRSQLMDNY